jgi:hypothetical protein
MVKDSRLKVLLEVVILFLFVLISTSYAAIPNPAPKLLMPKDIELGESTKATPKGKNKLSLADKMRQGKLYKKALGAAAQLSFK